MCAINCSGGCIQCAPEEHAFGDWWEANGADDLLQDMGDISDEDDLRSFLMRAFSAGFIAGEGHAMQGHQV